MCQRENLMSTQENGSFDDPQFGQPTYATSATARDDLIAQINGDGETFSTEVKKSADRSGCRFLFEFPAMLIDEQADKAAVILCPDETGFALVFLVYQQNQARIRIVEAKEAPMQLVDFSWSFARVLTYLPTPTEPSLQ
jgi:hypothetical protein